MSACTYCGRAPVGRADGRWHCEPCRAWVGSHRLTDAAAIAIATALRISEALTRMPPRQPRVLVWRRRCRARRVRSSRVSRYRLAMSIRRARGVTAAHVIGCALLAAEAVAATARMHAALQRPIRSLHGHRRVNP